MQVNDYGDGSWNLGWIQKKKKVTYELIGSLNVVKELMN